MILQSPQNTTEAFYIVIGAIFAFIIAVAALLTALGVIYAKLIKPVRQNIQERLFKPLEAAVTQVTDISKTLHSFDLRLTTIEQKLALTDVSLLAEQFKEIEKLVSINRYTFKFLFERDKNPIFFLNEKGDCIFVNNALCDLMGVDSTDLEYRNWIQKIHHSERAEVQRLWTEAYTNKAPYDNIQTLLIGNSTVRPKKMRVFAKPIIFDNAVVRYIGGVEETDN